LTLVANDLTYPKRKNPDEEGGYASCFNISNDCEGGYASCFNISNDCEAARSKPIDWTKMQLELGLPLSALRMRYSYRI